MIPRIVHFIWLGSPLPKFAQRNIDEWRSLNPDFHIMVHTNDSGLNPSIRAAYDATPYWESKSDLLRYSLLHTYGGWYFDCDFWPLRPLAHAVDAWGLRDTDFFISRQQGHKAGDRLPYANTPLACSPGNSLMAEIVQACALIQQGKSRVAYGPALVKRFVEARREQVTISEAGWWFPVDVRQSQHAYHILLHRPDLCDLRTPATAGQIPFAAHLWASCTELDSALSRDFDSRPLAAVITETNPVHYTRSVVKGLEALGFAVVETTRETDYKTMIRKPVIVCGWNGIRDAKRPGAKTAGWWDESEQIGAVHLACEHGFYDRQNRFQLDHRGFLHRSSLSAALRAGLPHPQNGASRLAQFVPQIDPMRARSGYMLILGQVDGDTQLVDADVPGHAPLLRHLSRNLPRGLRAVFRPHPQQALRLRSTSRWPSIEMQAVDAHEEKDNYRKHKRGSGLDEAFAGAAFCVAINSNALVEATARGIPCAAFGPALGLDAGVYRQLTPATVRADLQDMINGWKPEQSKVDNFLRWLACRQYGRGETESGEALRQVLERAGVCVPMPDTIRQTEEALA